MLFFFFNPWKSYALLVSTHSNDYMISYGPSEAKTCFRAYADSKGPDQPAYSRSLIRAIDVHKQNHWILKNVSTENKCPSESLRMCKMMLVL